MRSRSRSELRDDVIRHAVYPAGLLRAIEGQRRTESAGEGAKLMSYIPPEEQRIKIPTVTRGQVMVNTLVSWAELSHTMTGRGFVANGQAAGEDGSWLRLSARNAANLCEPGQVEQIVPKEAQGQQVQDGDNTG